MNVAGSYEFYAGCESVCPSGFVGMYCNAYRTEVCRGCTLDECHNHAKQNHFPGFSYVANNRNSCILCNENEISRLWGINPIYEPYGVYIKIENEGTNIILVIKHDSIFR